MGGYAASLTGVSGGAAPQSSSESSLSRWAALDDLGRRSIVEYMDMESLGGTDRAMTSKVDREEWMRALRGIKRTFLEQYMNKWFISNKLPSMLRWCIKRGIVVEGLRDCFQRYPVLFQTLLIREYEDVALWLIESKVIDVNKCSIRGGWSPCMYASYCGRVKILKALIGAGADVNHICSFGRFRTALSVARNNKHGECEAILKAAGAID